MGSSDPKTKQLFYTEFHLKHQAARGRGGGATTKQQCAPNANIGEVEKDGSVGLIDRKDQHSW